MLSHQYNSIHSRAVRNHSCSYT